MGVVSVFVGEKHAVERVDLSIEELLAQIPMDQLASQLGVSEEEASAAAKAAIPALLGGMGANAADPNGLASLESAVAQHDGGLLEPARVDPATPIGLSTSSVRPTPPPSAWTCTTCCTRSTSCRSDSSPPNPFAPGGQLTAPTRRS